MLEIVETTRVTENKHQELKNLNYLGKKLTNVIK
jgi:hypothetical protein